MSETDNWLERFGQSLSSLRNPFVYWIAVPMVILGTVGVMWSLHTPQQFYEISPLLNWGSAFLMVAAIYYFIISLSLAIGLLPFLLGLAAVEMWLLRSEWPQQGVSIALLIAGVTGLALARGGKPGRIIQDIQLMMIGPAWLLAKFYHRFGIPI